MQTLSYHDRIKLLRDKKIEHTLKKKELNGYMDGDDYGSIPKPEGYEFRPLYWADKDFFFGGISYAVNFKHLLEVHPLYVDPLEIMCGRWTDMLPMYARRGQAYDAMYPYDELKPLQQFYDIGSGIGADAHFACDYTIGLNLGFGGLLDKIRHYKKINPDKEEFYLAEEITIQAIIDFIGRHIEEIKRQLLTETRPELAATLREMLHANEAIQYGKPETFLEACQWIAWFNTVSRIYDRDGAGCNLDQILYPYYQRDIGDKLMDDEKATFILANLLLIDTHYYQLSGADEHDRDLTNHLSYLILDAAHWLNASANLTIRMHDNMDPAFLRRGVEYLFTDCNGWPRFSGDKGLMHYQDNEGITKKTARSRIAVGCNWMAVPGREYPLNDCVKINVARIFDIAFHEMFEAGENEKSIASLLGIFEKHLEKAVDITARGILHHLTYQCYIMPELVMNLMMENTLETGRDISECAELKTIGIDGVGLGTIADSLSAMEQRVEKEKLISWEELHDAIDNNFEGTMGERIRLMLKSSPRYCQGNSLGDKWAVRISRLFADKVKERKMPHGIQLIPGWFSWSSTIAFGEKVGATADGRFAFSPITHGANPNPGFRQDGAPTAMASGVAAIQTNYGNTCPLQIEFDPKVSAEQGGIERVEQVLKTHVDNGGTLININILDKEKLMKANENPMLYPDLVVRVTGFTAYFATLSPQFRKLVIDRFMDGM